ncbi:repair family protein, partial [Escherichia coli 88.0221]
RLRRRI